MARMRYHAVLIVTAGLAGCQPHPFSDQFKPEPRPLGSAYDTYHPPARPDQLTAVADPASQEPTGNLTLRDALSAALLRNPELASFGYDIRAAEARMLQAGLTPNPEVEFEAENFAGSDELEGFDGADFTLALSQNFPLGGDMKHRKEHARLSGELVGWDYEAARLALLTETTQRFIQLLSAQRHLDLAKESYELAGEVASTVRRRVDAGNTPKVELSRAAVPLAEAKIALRTAERSLEAARSHMSLVWGSRCQGFDMAVGDLDILDPVPDAEDLSAFINDNPDVARWAVEVASRQAEVELARAEAVPDLTGSLGYRWFNESDEGAFVAGISIPLPVLDRRQGDVLAARFGVESARNKANAIRLQVESALASSYMQLVNAYEESVLLRDEAIPVATSAYENIYQAYKSGNLGYIDVLDAERTLIDLRTRYLNSVSDYHIAVTETEALIGRPLSDVGQASPAIHSNETQAPQTGETE